MSANRKPENSPMQFAFYPNGRLTLNVGEKERISASPIGMILREGSLFLPQCAEWNGETVTLTYAGAASPVVLSYRYRENGSLRLEVGEIPDEIDGFVFGPYACPETTECGEHVGACWNSEGGAVCIQSLNPKTMGECSLIYQNTDGWHRPGDHAAYSDGSTGVLSCCAENMAKEKRIPVHNGFRDVTIPPFDGADAKIPGAAVVLTYGADADELLDDIGRLELEEGLPHPTINGAWAKTSPRAKDSYFVIGGGDTDEQVRLAERAGVSCIYFSDPFRSWGHFEINERQYPGGEEQFCGIIRSAAGHGVSVGFHTLSNFIHTYDPYVTPVPDKGLFGVDPVTLTAPVSAEDAEIPISEKKNYDRKTTVSAMRIGDELIRIGSYDDEKKAVVGCERGLFGTKACAHEAGETVTHLLDHGYATLFPDLNLQNEMADRIGSLIRKSGVRRLSFDGLEGCLSVGRGEYAASEYVRRVLAITGSELLCDASIPGHYRWHAHSYFNWGEPHYDFQRRGGMYWYRAKNLEIFRRNLLPNMLGWYLIAGSRGRFEATSAETMEYMLSRRVAFRAGLCFMVNMPAGDHLNGLMDLVRLWSEFEDTVSVPEEILAEMRRENTDWHLEKTDEGWKLSEMLLTEFDLGYCDRSMTMESGTTGYQKQAGGAYEHQSIIVIDRSENDITEPLHCRFRVGVPGAEGKMKDLEVGNGWYSGGKLLSFKFEADAGDYLEIRGGKTLYHYDRDFNLLETCESEGETQTVGGTWLKGYTFRYQLLGNDELPVMVTHMRTVKTWVFPIA